MNEKQGKRSARDKASGKYLKQALRTTINKKRKQARHLKENPWLTIGERKDGSKLSVPSVRRIGGSETLGTGRRPRRYRHPKILHENFMTFPQLPKKHY